MRDKMTCSAESLHFQVIQWLQEHKVKINTEGWMISMSRCGMWYYSPFCVSVYRVPILPGWRNHSFPSSFLFIYISKVLSRWSIWWEELFFFPYALFIFSLNILYTIMLYNIILYLKTCFSPIKFNRDKKI